MRNALFLLFFLVAVPAMANAGDLKIYTEDYPPFNTMQDGKVSGVSTELLLQALEKAGIGVTREDIELVPCARAYQSAQSTPNTCVYSTTRTQEREALFKWVGPLATSQNALVAKKGGGVVIANIDEAKSRSICVVRDDVGQQLVKEAGIPDSVVDVSTAGEHCLKKLDAGRVELFAYDLTTVKELAKQLGLNPESFEAAYVLKEGELYLACNPDTDDATLRKIQAGLEELKK